MFTIIFLISSLIVGIIGVFLWKQSEEHEPLYIGIVASLIFVVVLYNSCTYSVDSGEAVVLTKFGEVYAHDFKPGLHIKRPWASTIDWDIRLRAVKESVSTCSKDDASLTVHYVLWWKVMKDKVDIIYLSMGEYGRDLLDNFILPEVRSALRQMITTTDMAELDKNRERYAAIVLERVSSILSKKHLIVDRINIEAIIVSGGCDFGTKSKDSE